MSGFRILHFSDIHLGVFPPLREVFGRKAMMGALNHLLTRRGGQDLRILERLSGSLERLRPDFVVFTGDLTSIGHPRELREGAGLLEPFRRSAGEGFLAVPGNHDRYSPRPDWLRAARETYESLNGGRWPAAGMPATLATPQAEFVLLDAARPRPWYLSDGLLSPPEWARLEELLAAPPRDGRPRILVSHFPLTDRRGRRLGPRKRLQGDLRLARLAEEGAFQLLLCGHVHHAYVHRRPACTECCAGSLTLARRYLVVDYDPDTRSFHCTVNPI